jgi:glycosyltransferase involved in cell wall biosynthesis
MHILYLSLSYVPSRRASSIQVMKMCQALAQTGHPLTLVTKQCAARQEPGVSDDFAFYGVKPIFDIVKLARPENRGGGIRYTWEQRLLLRQWGSPISQTLVYSRDLWGGWLAARQGYPVLFEAHDLPEGRVGQRLMRQMLAASTFRRLVAISQALADDLAQAGFRPARGDVVIAHDGADLLLESGNADLKNDDGCILIGYVGHLYAGRGIEMILELAKQLPDYQFDIVGGAERDIEHWQFKKSGSNLVFRGFVPPAHLMTYLQHMDIVLMPYQRQVQVASGKADTSRWMSPMKLFEYMSAGKAIVSSDLPVLREVLDHERNALLVAPDDLDGWLTAVKRLIADPDLRQRLGQTARQDLLAHYTWEARAQKVLDGL